jgi:response regulator of citrate/malate metabolism
MKRYNILIIEDNPGDVVLIEDFLEETSLANNITSAKDFYSAKSLLLQAKNNYDIIFLDLSLPDKKGL